MRQWIVLSSQLTRRLIAFVCLLSIAVPPSLVQGANGKEARGGNAKRAPGPGPGPGKAAHGPEHSGGNRAPAPHGGPAAHAAPTAQRIGANHFSHGPHNPHGAHFVGNIHQSGPHWHSYHQAYVGHHPIHLAWAGYRPSYYYHPWYHGPWGGHAWGWGWGYGPGVTFGLGLGTGVGLAASWGYPTYYGPYGPYGYWGRPLGWGFGGWGLGTTVYSSGYYVYSNPYYVVGTYPVVYAQPIPVAVQAPPGTPTANLTPNDADTAAPPPDNVTFDMARQSFKRGDYVAALRDVDNALRKSPSDAVMHEFRALTLFALRDYRQSAAVVHSVLSVGPGWDHVTMTSLYPDPFTYTEQLRNLEDYAHSHPRAADAHFLLGYHEMIGSRNEEAAAELKQVVQLMPSDRLANELLKMVQGPPKTPSTPTSTEPPKDSDPVAISPPGTSDTSDVTSPTSPPDIEKAALTGTWTASRDDGSKFRLSLTDDGNFFWKFSLPNQKGEEFSGTYTTDGPVLVLQRKEGGALAGVATFSSDTAMNFKLVGGPTDDKGLDFGKL